MPLISVITVTYNAVHTIEATIRSIVSQSFKDFEFIIIDGGSSDGTLDIIDKYKPELSYVVSEVDKGIYDAMNKGINASKGEYIYFIGGDDILYDTGVLQNISVWLRSNELDLLAGEVIYNTGRRFHSFFGFKTLLNNTIHHQGAFYNRRLFSLFRYDTNFKLIADYELNLNLYNKRQELKYKMIPTTISLCQDGGASRKELGQAYHETNKVRAKVLGRNSIILKYIFTIKFFISKYAF